MSKHTPAPWAVRGISMEDGSISVGSEEQRIVIACVTNAASFGEILADTIRRGTPGPDAAVTQMANARLIAAAPDLLTALRLLVADVADYEAWKRPCHALDVANAAIAKAEGTQ